MPDFLEESAYDEDGHAPFGFRPPLECEQPYTVSQINTGIAQILEAGNTLVWFVGEVSNCKRHTSGHCYLRLKDAYSQIPAVIWSSTYQRLTYRPEDGQEVSGVAAIRVYRKGGYYQLDIRRLQPGGLGELYAAFEALKKRLMAAGLFDEAHKQPLPSAVNAIGVVTSKTGAALRDIVRVVKTRAPGTDIVLTNVRVQGDGAAEEIAAGIRRFNRHGGVDVLIVGRGGGSIEDLWAFNEEAVARAIYESSIPVISAVGHETDFTIADFVADVRAPTPSAAAETAVADDRERQRYFLTVSRRFIGGAMRCFETRRRELERLKARPALHQPVRRLLDSQQLLDDSRARAYRAMGVAMRLRLGALRASSGRLSALSPLRVLERGYSVVLKSDGSAVRDSRRLSAGEQVSIRFSRGHANATITEVSVGDAAGQRQGER